VGGGQNDRKGGGKKNLEQKRPVQIYKKGKHRHGKCAWIIVNLRKLRHRKGQEEGKGGLEIQRFVVCEK